MTSWQNIIIRLALKIVWKISRIGHYFPYEIDFLKIQKMNLLYTSSRVVWAWIVRACVVIYVKIDFWLFLPMINNDGLKTWHRQFVTTLIYRTRVSINLSRVLNSLEYKPRNLKEMPQNIKEMPTCEKIYRPRSILMRLQ